MRALGYFTFDPGARKGALAYQSRYLAFRRFCEKNRHTDSRAFADPIGEEGAGGWRKMVDFIRDAELGYLVVVPSAEVLGVSLEDQVERVLEADALDSRVVCADPNYPDPLQNALRGAGAAGRRERIREGMLAKAAKGRGLGRPPFGYRILVNGDFETVPEEAEIVRLIFDEYLQCGGGVRVVAAELNRRGLRTRAGKQWSMVTVRDILSNAAYIGAYRRFGLRIPGSFEPIVDSEVFRRVQQRLRDRSPRRPRPRRASFLLTGLLFCGHCGGAMMGVTRRRTWTRKNGRLNRAEYRYYQCQSRINRNECDYHTVHAGDIEERVVGDARRQLLDGGQSGPDGLDSRLDRDRADCAARLRALDRRFLNGVRRAADGKLTLAQLRVGAERLRAARESLDLRMAATADSSAAKALFDDNAARFAYEWDNLSHEERRDLLRLLVARATLKNKRIDVVLA